MSKQLSKAAYECPKCLGKTDKLYSIGLFEQSTEETFSACRLCKEDFLKALEYYELLVHKRRSSMVAYQLEREINNIRRKAEHGCFGFSCPCDSQSGTEALKGQNDDDM